MRQQKYYEAYLDDFDKVIVYMSKNSYDGVSNRFFLRDQEDSLQELHIQSIETTHNNFNKYTLSIHEPICIGKEYYVVHQHARSVILQYSGIVKTAQFDELFYYDGDDLGCICDGKTTTFSLWAPSASRVKLEVMKNDITYTYEMLRSERGVFRFSLLDNLENATYVYLVRVNGEWKQTIDPYGVASIENAHRSAIVDITKLRSKTYELPVMKSACDAIIYEASVRDFTIQHDNGVEHKGKFIGFVEENEETLKKHTGFAYLKSLGITHVQLMPVMDFGSVDEVFPLMHYNWGYDPVQYRTLEGSFSSDPTNPYSRMFEFIKVVEECHKNGIRVNLDVVFNHVYDSETHAFENCVPSYYFQMNEQGDFSNGTYCGNDIDSTRRMCSKYIIDACRFLVKTYHIDGLRFDLMGILDVNTMNSVYEACVAINPDFMIYGEGWDMPSFLDWRKRASMQNNAQMPFIGHFSDRFRDVVKGRTATNEVNIKGYCTGAIYLLETMKNCMAASCIPVGMEMMFAHPRNCVNYVECHDNMTSWDKVKECCKEEVREIRIARQKMMNAAVLLAQGIPFLHCGQEFARTKHGIANTYEESDEINKIDYHRRNQYQEIVDSTKDLIAIRKAHACLRYATKEEVEQHVSFSDIDQKVLIYRIQSDEEDMMIFFNPTLESFHYDLKDAYVLLYDNRLSEEIRMKKIDIHPLQVLILTRKKENSLA